MFFFRRKRPKVCKPEFLMEELERRISFDASMGDLLFHDPLPNLADIPHATPSDHHVVLITDSVAATDGVRQAIPKDSHVIVVDSHRDNLKTINEKIAEQVQADGRKIGALAVLAHAEKGKVFLGTDKIDLANAQEFKPQLEELGKNFGEKGQVQLFGCSLAEDVYGKGLVEVISVATHTDVFASTNSTGHGPGKDWALEYSTNPQTQMKTTVDAEQLASLPLDLAPGDVVITKGTVGPVVQGTTTVNLNHAFAVTNANAPQATTATVLANPSSSNGWTSISVDTAYAASLVPAVTVTGSGTDKITISGNPEGQVTAVLGTLQGALSPTFSGTAQILIYAQSSDSDWAADTLDVTVNPAPTHVVAPATKTVAENSTAAIPGIYVSTADVNTTGQLTVTLSVSHGTLTVQVPATTPGTTPTNYTSASLTFTDTLANVNTALAGLKYTPSTGFTGTDQLDVTAVDQSTPSPGSGTANVVITVDPITYAAPEITVPGAQSLSENSSLSITGISVTDNDIGDTGKLTVTLSVSHGTLTVQVPATPPGTTPTTYTNANITFTDTLANVNTALAGLIYTPTSKYDDTDTLYITAVNQRPDPQSDNKMVAITVNNVAPTISPHAAVTAVAGSPTSITGITVADPDIGSTNMSVTLSVTHGVLSVAPSGSVVGNGTSSLAINDTLANVNTLLAGLQYTPSLTYAGADALKITANDQSTPAPGIGNLEFAIAVDPIAYEAPVVTVPGAQTVPENSSLSISGISVTDADIGTTGKLTVTLSVAHGTVTVQVPGTTLVTYTNSIVTFTETLANVNTALAGLIYTPTSKYEGNDILHVTAVDQSPEPQSGNGAVAITVANTPPTITAPATANASAGNPTAITGIAVTDPDIGSTNIAVTLSVSHGVLNVPASGSVTGNGTGTLIINATLANVNTLLSGLQYTSTTTYSGPDTLSINANDESTPTPGIGTATVAITVDPVSYTAPVITVPGAQTVPENSSVSITGISVTDADIGTTGKLTVTLSVSHGTLTVQVPATPPGTTPTTYTNVNITFTDTLANVNTALAGLIYTPTAKYDSADTLTITAVDQSPDPLSDSATVAITVTNVAPTITAPATATAVTATSTAITGISIADPDIAATNMTVTLSVSYGVLNVPSSSSVTGNGTSTVTINDTLANLNTQLAGLRYTSNSGFTGIDTLSITANDLSTPTTGTDFEQVPITVTRVPTPAASPPTINAPSVLSVNEDTTLAVQIGPNNPISVQYGDTTTELRVTLTANNGNLTLGWKGHLNSYVGDGTLKVNFTGPLAAINEALYGLKYAPVHNYFDTTDDTMTIRVDDQAGQVTTQTMAINVYSVNDPPVITVPGIQSINVNTPKVISGVSVADPDVGAGGLRMTLGALHGTLSVTGVGPSADITFTDTLTNVNTLLGTLTYRPVSGYWGPDWITITANDQGNSGAGGAMSDTKKVSLRVGIY